jgi:RNA polymerase sigma-70 factor (ECF subfamily)
MPATTAPSGEHISVDALYRAHASFVAGFLVRLGAPTSELEDLVQEVFVVAHRKGGYVTGPAQPRSWLGAIALRVALASRRARTLRNRRESLDADSVELAPIPAGATSDPGVNLEARRALARVQRALETLPDEYRAAFLLFEIEGESCESIAAVWNVPVGTIYSRLHHARRRFMQAHAALSEQPSAWPARRAGQGAQP